MEFKGKRILVCGAARSGIAAAKLLAGLGADVTLQDLKEKDKIGASLSDIENCITLHLGKNPDGILAGFDLLVISPGIPTHLPFVSKARDMGIPVWGEIELACSLCPCPIIAVTGTNGKTTTTALIGEIAKSWNPKTEVVGNIGVPFTEKVSGLDGDSLVVAELSSFQLETVCTFKPKVSAILNVTPDHLDRHKTMEGYFEAKQRVGAFQDETDFMVLNWDDELCRKIQTKAKKVLFSRREILKEGFYLEDGLIKASFKGENITVLNMDDMLIFGSHNIENTLAAVAACACMGIPYGAIEKAALEFKAVEHRIEFVRELNGVKFYNDSKATNPDAAIKAIEAMKQPIVLIGGGYDKHSDFSDWVKTFEGRVKHAVVLGQVAGKIIEACKACGFERLERVKTLEDAVLAAYAKASPGDCVLLSPACASWDMFADFEQRGAQFKHFVNNL
jgi:UDP-N-acetylmuramoylalanine--D-glutamate ligase